MINFSLGDIVTFFVGVVVVLFIFVYLVANIPLWVLRDGSSLKRMIFSGALAFCVPALFILYVGRDDVPYEMGLGLSLGAFFIAAIIEWRRRSRMTS